jgi:hypothetical protein
LACSVFDVFAGCGVLNPLNMLALGASGALNIEVLDDWPVDLDALSLLWLAPKVKPVLLAAGVAAGVLLGFASEANRFGLGVSDDASFVCSVGFRLPNGLAVAGAFSCAWGVCWVPAPNSEVVLVAVWRFAKGLLAGADAGVLAACAAALEAPKRLVDGAGVAAVSGFGVVEPKLNRPAEGAVAGGSAAGVLAPKLNMLFCGVVGVVGVSFFCVLAPNPNMLLDAGAAAGCEAPNPPNPLLGAGVLAFSGAGEAGAPKVKGWEAGAGVDAVLGAEDVVLPKENAGAGLFAPLVADELALPNMLG